MARNLFHQSSPRPEARVSQRTRAMIPVPELDSDYEATNVRKEVTVEDFGAAVGVMLQQLNAGHHPDIRIELQQGKGWVIYIFDDFNDEAVVKVTIGHNEVRLCHERSVIKDTWE